MMKKILVTPRSFAKYNYRQVAELFKKHNVEAEFNPYGQIMTEDQISDLLSDKDGVIVGVDPLHEEVLRQAPQLKAIAKYGVGVDNIDTGYTDEHAIKVSRTLNANADAVADYSFALLMAVARRVVEINNGCKAGDWQKKIALDIFEKKIGILGLGAIGRGVVKRAQGFDMSIYAYDMYPDEAFVAQNDIRLTDVDTIIRECDFISIHLPLTPDTKHLLNADNLKQAKKNLIIVNTARGGIVDEETLYQLCKENRIFGAGIDVFEQEPPQQSKLLELENVVIGSHTAASTVGATEKMSLMAAENIIKDLED